jgi:hypothetical protein
MAILTRFPCNFGMLSLIAVPFDSKPAMTRDRNQELAFMQSVYSAIDLRVESFPCGITH